MKTQQFFNLSLYLSKRKQNVELNTQYIDKKVRKFKKKSNE